MTNQFQPIRVTGINDKAATDLRTFADQPREQRRDVIALDLTPEPDSIWINIFNLKWSQKLFHEAVAAGGLKSPTPYNGDPATRRVRDIELEESLKLQQRIFSPRAAATPSFSGATIYWIIESAAMHGGTAAYVSRCLEIIEETNRAYPSDPRVIERDEVERRKVMLADTRRAEIENLLAEVRNAITASTPRDAARAKAKK